MPFMRPRIVLAPLLFGILILAFAPATVAATTPSFTLTKDVPFMPFRPVLGGRDTLKVDVYTPSTPPPPGGYPTMVAIHGAWESSDKGSAAYEAGVFATHGYLAFAPDYRSVCDPYKPPPSVDGGLCGFYYPTQPEDVAYFINWTRAPEQVSTYHVDPTDLGVFGTSGGATLATLMGTSPSVYGLDQRPNVVVELSGQLQMYDYEFGPKPDTAGGRDITYMQCTYGMGNHKCDAMWHETSPYDSAGPGDAPTYLANGEYEIVPLFPAQNLATRFAASGVPSSLRVVPGVSHGSNAEPIVIAGCCTTVMDESVSYADTYLMPDPSADLAISGSTTPAANVSSGATLTYNLTVTNNGPQFATGATLTDPLPAGLSFMSATSSLGSCTGSTTVVCTFEDLPPLTPVTVAIRVTPTAPVFYTNAPAVSLSRGPASDPTPSNDSVSLTTQAVSQVSADTALTMTTSADSLKANTPLAYTLTVTNNGPAADHGVVVTDILPPGVPLTSISPSQGSCSGTTTVVCLLGGLSSGQSAAIRVVVTPSVTGSINNNASVTANAVDEKNANDSASATTKVTKAPGYRYESVTDTGFSHRSVNLTVGRAIEWYLLAQGPGPGPGSGVDTWGHSAADADGFSPALFDSGILDPSGSFGYRFTSAGTYTINDIVTDTDQTVRVGLRVAPKSGTHSTTFTITWAKQTAPAGFAYDIQLQKPGGPWADWAKGVTTPSGSFTPAPTDPTGQYMFRALLRATSGAGRTGYSTGTVITVT